MSKTRDGRLDRILRTALAFVLALTMMVPVTSAYAVEDSETAGGGQGLSLEAPAPTAQARADSISLSPMNDPTEGYDLATVGVVAKSDGGEVLGIKWPDGMWLDKPLEGYDYSWLTYIKGDNAHYGHYDAIVSFKVEDGKLVAADMTSLGTTVGGKWGTLTPHGGAGLLGVLPKGVSSTTDTSSYATDKTIRTIGLSGAGEPPTVTGQGRNAKSVYGPETKDGYGGYTINSIALRSIAEDGTVATEKWTDPADGDVEYRPVGYSVTPTIAVDDETVKWDPETGELLVKATETYNVLCIEYKVGDYYVFETRHALDESAGAKIYAEQKTDMTVEPSGIGAKDRDVYTAAAFNIIVRKQLGSYLAYTDGSDELADIDIVSAATKSSDSIIEAIYASQGYFYPRSNTDDAIAEPRSEWGTKFTSVSPDVVVSMDGEPLGADSTAIARAANGTATVTEGLFGDNVALAGFDLYKLDGKQSPASLWRLGTGAYKDQAVGTYLTNYVSETGHGLVGAYGLSPKDTKQTYKDRNNPVDDILDDSLISYDPQTKKLTIKDPNVTHVVFKYAVGKFNDSAGGVCGIAYELPVYVNKDALRKAVSAANSAKAGIKTSSTGKDLANGTSYVAPAALTTLNKAISSAQAVLANASATQQDVDAATKALTSAKDTFNKAKKTASVNKTALNNAIKAAKASETGIKTSSKSGTDVPKTNKWTTPAEKTALDNAIAAAQKVANNKAATQNQTDAATKALNTAKAAYEKAKKLGKKATVWKRVSGQTALDTMAKITQEFGKANVAIVTTNADFKDALAAAALAGANNAPVLMTAKGSLSAQTKSELIRMGVTKVYVVGDTKAVPAKVFNQIKALPKVKTVSREAGKSASGNAIAAAKAQGAKRSKTVIIATQASFKDALSVAPYAYATQSPILYVESNKKLSAASVAYIKSAKFSHAIIVGGPVAIPASVETQLKNAGIKVANQTRLAGANSYQTSNVIAKWAMGKLNIGAKPNQYAKISFKPAVTMSANKLGVSTGQNWKDALAGAALCGKNRSVLLLEDKANYNTNVAISKTYKASIVNAYVFGGEAAVQKVVWNACVASTK